MKICNKNRSLLSIANAFSGGIFLAIALLHIIPEAHTHYLVYMHKGAVESEHTSPHPRNPTYIPSDNSKPVLLGGVHRNLHGIDNVHEFLELGFPLPYFMVFCGYTFILILDKVMFDSHSLVHEHGDKNALRESFRKSLFDNRRRSNSQADLHSHQNNGKAGFEDNKKYNEFNDEDEHVEETGDDGINEAIRHYLSKADRFSARMNSALSDKYSKGTKRGARNANLRANTGEPHNLNHFGNHSEASEDSHINEHIKSTKCDLTPYVLMIALSVHSVLEGIAVGLQDDVADIWSFLIVISTHKWVEAMSLGTSMSRNLEHSPSTVKILILTFSLATPIGIVMGMIVMEAAPLINIIFSGLAGGTFLYIAASELVVEEFAIPTQKWIKLCGFIIGALIITFVTSIESE